MFLREHLNILKVADNISCRQLFWWILPLFAFLHHICYLTNFHVIVKDFLFSTCDNMFIQYFTSNDKKNLFHSHTPLNSALPIEILINSEAKVQNLL